jgi:ribonuclease P protein component
MPALRFPRSARITRSGEFARLKREGVSFHGKLMVLSVLRIEPTAATRIGVVTSRRLGGAVQRNRVRRRLREIVRLARPALARGLWVVIVARRGAAGAEFAALRDDWTRLAERSSILAAPCP